MTGLDHWPVDLSRRTVIWVYLGLIVLMEFFVIGPCGASDSSLTRRVTFSIPEQRLDRALIEFSKQARVPVSIAATASSRILAPALIGNMDAGTALHKLLGGSGLRYEQLGGGTVMVLQENVGAPGIRWAEATASAPPSMVTSAPSVATDESIGSVATSRSSQNLVRHSVLEEVVVSAEKRTDRLQDVPVPVAVIQADSLIESDQSRLQDYFSSMPGLSLSPSPGAGGEQVLAIRGISTGAFAKPTVGVTVDDVPFGSTTSFAGNVIPDIDPSDLARVELLRGPQGTLYGASSMGGLLKFVTADPSTDRVRGNLQGGVSTISHGSQAGYNVRASVNVPLTDTMAIRASGFTREVPGYIDNPDTHVNGVNEERVRGGRLSALWKPLDVLSVKLSALYQDDKGDGSSDVLSDPALRSWQQNYIPNTGSYDRKTQAYSADLNGKLGDADLTSVTGYNINKFSNSLDYSYALGQCCTLPLYGVTGTPLFTDGTTKKFTQELRAAIPINRFLDWLLGGFYTRESSPYEQAFFAEDRATGALLARTYYTTAAYVYREYAAFTDLTVHVTDQFDIQVGGRESEIKQTLGPGSGAAPLFGINDVTVSPSSDSKANAFTYLVTPRFKISPDMMVYVRLASGYRPGGANGTGDKNDFCVLDHYPCQFAPDKTHNYEIGAKGNIHDHLLVFDASLYYIDWKGIQLSLQDLQSGGQYLTNGGRAKSEGVEVSVESRPITGMTLALWGTYNNAVLTEDFPANSTAYGVSGDRLPFSSRFASNLSVDQECPIVGGLTGFVGTTISYVGSRLGTFIATPQREVYPAYTKVDLRAGMKYESWTGNVYATNVGDRRGLLGGGAGTFPPNAFSYIQPRSFGLVISKTF